MLMIREDQYSSKLNFLVIFITNQNIPKSYRDEREENPQLLQVLMDCQKL